MEREYKNGQHVVYVDPVGQRRDALVTIWWAGGTQEISAYRSANGEPGCNLVVVTDDAKKTDNYGSQTEHWSSVVHKTKQPAHGNYWMWSDEE